MCGIIDNLDLTMVAVLDRYYLSITLLVTVAYQLSGFAIAYTLQFDVAASSNRWIPADFSPENYGLDRRIQLSDSGQALRFLFFRVLKTGHDGRFDEIRRSFFKFLGFWIAQILWVWVVSLPVVILNSPAVSDVDSGGSNPKFGTSRDVAGVVLWALGFVIESAADAQKYRYKSSKSSPKDRPIEKGVWAYSRHPQYFGEMMCWFGIWILCLSPTTNGSLPSSARAAQYGAIVSPVLTVVVLMFGSGMPTSAKPQAKRFYLKSYGPDARPEDAIIWAGYKEYLNRVSILVPLPPFIYAPLPRIVKRTVLFDFPMFQFNEETDGPAAIEEATQRST
ncbi:DUF1295-domain-containing protein [Mycena kentingensis (nom. inval.)]|nr:DUF1295-domain-containing protein [Mycena kentingensis (nom. inval.)]